MPGAAGERLRLRGLSAGPAAAGRRCRRALSKTYLRANVFDWYAQDDWRALANLTLNFGLRYEYFSPYVEKDNQLVNLDHNADFTRCRRFSPARLGLQRRVSAIAE